MHMPDTTAVSARVRAGMSRNVVGNERYPNTTAMRANQNTATKCQIVNATLCHSYVSGPSDPPRIISHMMQPDNANNPIVQMMINAGISVVIWFTPYPRLSRTQPNRCGSPGWMRRTEPAP
jgi:hypothetical protein